MRAGGKDGQREPAGSGRSLSRREMPAGGREQRGEGDRPACFRRYNFDLKRV